MDSGRGIPENVSEKIFDPFFTTKEKGKGTGMGLSVVLGIVNKMGGSIDLSSTPGKGTRFSIYFPAQKAVSPEENNPEEDKLPGGSETILLVDDEEGILSMEQKMLKRLGYVVFSRPGSLEALELFRDNSNQFDLVITDLAMPGMPGDKLAADLLKIKPDIRIILCTGFSEKMTPDAAGKIGIKEVLMKPVIMKHLAKKVRTVLDQVP